MPMESQLAQRSAAVNHGFVEVQPRGDKEEGAIEAAVVPREQQILGKKQAQ